MSGWSSRREGEDEARDARRAAAWRRYQDRKNELQNARRRKKREEEKGKGKDGG